MTNPCASATTSPHSRSRVSSALLSLGLAAASVTSLTGLAGCIEAADDPNAEVDLTPPDWTEDKSVVGYWETADFAAAQATAKQTGGNPYIEYCKKDRSPRIVRMYATRSEALFAATADKPARYYASIIGCWEGYLNYSGILSGDLSFEDVGSTDAIGWIAGKAEVGAWLADGSYRRSVDANSVFAIEFSTGNNETIHLKLRTPSTNYNTASLLGQVVASTVIGTVQAR